MKFIFILLLSLSPLFISAQNHTYYAYTYYAALKAGLSLRDQPNVNAKVISKIEYGQKIITQYDSTELSPITTEGFNGIWWKVKFNNKIGYVVSSYLLPAPPPKAGVKTLKDYFAQVSSIAGNKVIVKNGSFNNIEEGGYELTKQLYKNGMEWHETQGYEYGSEVYILPDFTVEQCFLLLRIIRQYPDLIAEKDSFPVKNSKTSNDIGGKTITVEKENLNSLPIRIKKLSITVDQGGYTDFEIFDLDGQGVISFSSGV